MGWSDLVDATEVKAKIAELRDYGWGTRRIAKSAGIDRSLVQDVLRGQATITAKTRDAICALHAQPDRAAIAHRALCEAGMRNQYVSPRRKHRRTAREKKKWVNKWIAGTHDATELAAERSKELPLRFDEALPELREHCGMSDFEIAQHLGVTYLSLLRQFDRYGIQPQPQFLTVCVEIRRGKHQCG